jgi:hypothetical protein
MKKARVVYIEYDDDTALIAQGGHAEEIMQFFHRAQDFYCRHGEIFQGVPMHDSPPMRLVQPPNRDPFGVEVLDLCDSGHCFHTYKAHERRDGTGQGGGWHCMVPGCNCLSYIGYSPAGDRSALIKPARKREQEWLASIRPVRPVDPQE